MSACVKDSKNPDPSENTPSFHSWASLTSRSCHCTARATSSPSVDEPTNTDGLLSDTSPMSRSQLSLRRRLDQRMVACGDVQQYRRLARQLTDGRWVDPTHLLSQRGLLRPSSRHGKEKLSTVGVTAIEQLGRPPIRNRQVSATIAATQCPAIVIVDVTGCHSS